MAERKERPPKESPPLVNDRSKREINVRGNVSGSVVMGDGNSIKNGNTRSPSEETTVGQSSSGSSTATIAGVVGAAATVIGVIVTFAQLQPCANSNPKEPQPANHVTSE